MSVSNLREMFVHDLEDLYYAETELLDALSDFADRTRDEEIAEAFREHRAETHTHIDRLDEVFEMLGREPDTEECEGIDGIIAEHEGFVRLNPDQDLLDLHVLMAAQKAEHYEIAAYGNMALVADRLGMDEAADLLGTTLEDEQATLEDFSRYVDAYEFERVIDEMSAE